MYINVVIGNSKDNFFECACLSGGICLQRVTTYNHMTVSHAESIFIPKEA
jgi:hypothetical protein